MPAGVAWGTYFTAYDAIKRLHSSALGVERLSPGWHTASAAEAGALVCA
jgi:hypothetical protein